LLPKGLDLMVENEKFFRARFNSSEGRDIILKMIS